MQTAEESCCESGSFQDVFEAEGTGLKAPTLVGVGLKMDGGS